MGTGLVSTLTANCPTDTRNANSNYSCRLWGPNLLNKCFL